VSPENGIAQAKRRERSHARERARDQHLLLVSSGENNKQGCSRRAEIIITSSSIYYNI
jgi:hypothetical protein